MTPRQKQEFLSCLQARLAKLEAEIASEIEAEENAESEESESEAEFGFDELDEHAKDAVFMIEDMMEAVEVAQ